MAEEIVDIVDESGHYLHQATKSEAHQQGWLHPIVIGQLRRSNGWTLVRQASDRQDAGQLVSPVGGHVQTGEKILDALHREVEEEIGVQEISHRYIGKVRFHRQILGRNENHLFYVYEITTEEELLLGSEAASVEDFTTQQLKDYVYQAPDEFGDAFYCLAENFYPELLPKNWQYRWFNPSL